jgi:hypothetical protein
MRPRPSEKMGSADVGSHRLRGIRCLSGGAAGEDDQVVHAPARAARCEESAEEAALAQFFDSGPSVLFTPAIRVSRCLKDEKDLCAVP